ncbi:hypothetical protein Gotri_025081 [Gossypium trilobum]|uniref:IBR domain-containing protein n=1 Tax=Gossypium trilobum TaxID=34281 RepID=A0A7J9FS95_9ROSI|nr:hypothetical protein [Gossypium trilobum]
MEETDESIVGVEEDEEDFRSYCEDEDVWKETEGVVKEEVNEFSVKMFFKGISLAEFGDSFFGFSGIGVVMEGSANSLVIQVQKKLDFYVDESVVDYLALMDGLTAAMQNKIRTVYALADSPLLYDQFPCKGGHARKKGSKQLSHGVQQLELEVAEPLAFVSSARVEACCPSKTENSLLLPLTPTFTDMNFWQIMYKKKLDNPLLLALRERILELAHNLEEFVLKLTPSINLLRPLQLAQILSSTVFLQVFRNGIYCPYRNCSILLDPRECLSAGASSSTQSDNSCVECPVCRRFICVECGVPWHSSTSCEEYQNLPLEERDATDITLHLLAQNKRWKPYQQCTRMIELTQGTFLFAALESSNRPVYQGLSLNGNLVGMLKNRVAGKWPFMLRWSLGVGTLFVQWACETFNSLPMIMDAYSDQERSHRALIKRFLAGGFSLSDHHPSPLCTDSYVDTMKDLHQLPWFQ